MQEGIVAGVMTVTRTSKFRVRAAPVRTQSVIIFSSKYVYVVWLSIQQVLIESCRIETDPSVSADLSGDRRRITQLFQTVVHQPVPICFNVLREKRDSIPTPLDAI
jgi:hypothetical protein